MDSDTHTKLDLIRSQVKRCERETRTLKQMIAEFADNLQPKEAQEHEREHRSN